MRRFAMTLLALGATAMARADEPKVAEVVKGNNHFALDLYSRLKDQPGNLFFSPYSISTALAMTYAGARGETAEQMARTLRFAVPSDELHPAFSVIGKALDPDRSERGYRLSVANRLWGQEGYHFSPGFLSLTRESYAAELAPLDFERQAERSRAAINAWIAQRTQGKIDDLIRPGDLDSTTRLVLTNAVYFKGEWTSRFDRGATKEAPFRTSQGRIVRVPMMHQRSILAFRAGDGFKVVALTYVKGDLTMYVLLPDDAEGLARLESRLTEANLTKWLGGLDEAEVDLSFPRFTMSSRLKLTDVLKGMGMSKAFTPGQSDFSGIGTEDDLSLSEAIQEALVEVNEEGTEAIAAFAGGLDLPGPPEPPLVEFRADRPFLFLIRDKATGSILFLGRVTNPQG